MKKIVPIILLCLTAIALLSGGAGLIMTAAATRVPQITPLGLAAAIPALALAIFCGGLNFLFKRDILCRIGFWISLFAFACSIVSIIIWLAVLR